MIAWHQLTDNIGHDRHPIGAIGEDDDGRTIRQRAGHERLELPVIAPMEECASIWFKSPTESPCNMLIGILPIGREALDAALPKPDLRLEPLSRGLRFETPAG